MPQRDQKAAEELFSSFPDMPTHKTRAQAPPVTLLLWEPRHVHLLRQDKFHDLWELALFKPATQHIKVGIQVTVIPSSAFLWLNTLAEGWSTGLGTATGQDPYRIKSKENPLALLPGYGTLPLVTSSVSKIPKDHTSDLIVNLPYRAASGAVHLMGNFAPAEGRAGQPGGREPMLVRRGERVLASPLQGGGWERRPGRGWGRTARRGEDIGPWAWLRDLQRAGVALLTEVSH